MLDNDDYYEIEKILDAHAANISDTIARYCHVAVQHSALNNHKTPLDAIIVDMVHARDRVKHIRDELQKMRLNKDQKITIQQQDG